MDRGWFAQACRIAACGCLFTQMAIARTDTLLVGSAIPSRFLIPASRIFSNSDTLYMNGRLLARGTEYRLGAGENLFELAQIQRTPNDTLRIIYHEWPNWMLKSFGRPIPEATDRPTVVPQEPTIARSANPGLFGEGVRIDGAKSFRFSTRTSGNAEFGQSLDLRLSGELSPGFELTGAISDRGYNPSYGTSNSRLSELDKVNLQLKSSHLQARVGDIDMAASQKSGNKQASGFSIALSYPQWQAHGAIARPRGRFQTISFPGLDGFQGPYQIASGSKITPVVPNSETVWLDGQKLERGIEKDYSIDYPAGRITLSSRHPIDRRSRFEVDFEPQLDAYRMEMAEVGGAVQAKDSLFAFSVDATREGDNRNQSIGIGLSETDRQILENSADSAASRSGVVQDTAGDYELETELLPDSVFRYVGPSNGTYRITFTYVGIGRGSYHFFGAGNYQFAGRDSGDYLPIVILTKPERLDSYRARASFRPSDLGRFTVDYRQTEFDDNLFSSQPRTRQTGRAYLASYARQWQSGEQINSISLSRRYRQPTFRSRERFSPVDLVRDFLVPTSDSTTSSTETWQEFKGEFHLIRALAITPSYSTLSYGRGFSSRAGSVGIVLRPLSHFTSNLSWRAVAAHRSTDSASLPGEANSYAATVAYRFSQDHSIEIGAELDSREHYYSGLPKGTRFVRSFANLTVGHERLRYEYYREDSLSTTWFTDLRRQRITSRSERALGNLRYQIDASYQWLQLLSSRQGSFLARSNLTYSNPQKNFAANAAISLSDELRSERGISYLEVPSGRGNYILDNGRYVPDPDGNFVQVEEILSAQSRVRRAEKNFQFSKDWRDVSMHFTSEVKEELLPAGTRPWIWALPFYSDESEAYLYLSRRYAGDLHLFGWSTFHFVNLEASEELEKRRLGSQTAQRRDQKLQLMFKEALGRLYCDQALDLYHSRRDAYFSSGGDISGYKVRTGVKRTLDVGEYGASLSYRRAASSHDEQSRILSIITDIRSRLRQRGELRISVELFRQILDRVTEYPSYQLTDNHFGQRGANWSLALNYRMREGMRLNITLSGRSADDRAARITARGEFVTEF